MSVPMRSPERQQSSAGARNQRKAIDSAEGARGWGVTPRRGDFARGLAADCRFALRSCLRDWRLGSLMGLMVAFGIGSAAAVFSIADQLLLQPPPGVNADRNVSYLQLLGAGASNGAMGEGISTPAFRELRRAATSISGMASYGDLQAAASVGTNHPIEALGTTIYGEFFEILGVRAVEGSLLYERDTELGQDPHLIVISASLRDRLFGSASAVGKSVSLNGVRFTVRGVAAGGFAGPDRGRVSDFWVPHGALTPLYGFEVVDLASPETRMHRDILVRTNSGVRASEAEAQIASILQRFGPINSTDVPNGVLRPRLIHGLGTPPIVRGRTQRLIGLLTIVAILVFLIVCANMSNVLLLRSLKRRTTTATLLAVGASRLQIARQHLAHSVLLGLAGAAGAVPIAWAICRLLGTGAFDGMPVVSGFHYDRALIVLVPIAGLFAGALCGVAPAILATRLNLATALREGGVTHSGQRRTIRFAFATAQLALSIMLTVGALLLLHTIRNLYQVKTGVRTEGVLALSLHHSPRLSPAETHALYRRLLMAVKALPNIDEAALDPYGLPDGIFASIGVPSTSAPERVKVKMIPATPGLIQILHIPVLTGREFQDGDWKFDQPGGVVLTESLARKLFGHADVAGRQVAISPSKQETILGVVGDIRSPMGRAPEEAFFITYGDIARLGLQYFTLLVTTRHPGMQTAQQIRAAVQDALPEEAVPEVRFLSTDVSRVYSEPLLLARLLSLLALFGFVIAALGLYGVTATTVEDRRHELAIRAALGARPMEIGRAVTLQTVAIVGLGVPIGLSGAYALGQVLRTELFDVTPIDPLSYLAAVALLVTVVLGATAGPMQRAMNIDPMRALREK